MPLTAVCAIHIVVSAGDFVTHFHVGPLLLQEPVKEPIAFVIVRPFITD